MPAHQAHANECYALSNQAVVPVRGIRGDFDNVGNIQKLTRLPTERTSNGMRGAPEVISR
jgi:hypothetical protein